MAETIQLSPFSFFIIAKFNQRKKGGRAKPFVITAIAEVLDPRDKDGLTT